jgi:hypothetical protein
VIDTDKLFLNNSTWQIRRVLWTKEIMCFARMGEEQLIDAIPLSEIKNIESVGSNPMDRKERQTASSQHLLSDLQNVSAPSEGMRSANC